MSACIERSFIVQTLTDEGDRFCRRCECGGRVYSTIEVGREALHCDSCEITPDFWYIVDSHADDRRVGYGTPKHGGRLVLTADEAIAIAAADEARVAAAKLAPRLGLLRRRRDRQQRPGSNTRAIESLEQEMAALHHAISVLASWATR